MLPETKEVITKPKDFVEMIHDKNNESRFADMLGPRAASYIQSTVLLYRSDEKLHVCTPESVIGAALRSASCELQVDPTYRQAYIIPRPRKIKSHKDPITGMIVPEYYRTEANFQPHYHGLEVLAHRTNLYRAINVSPIYKGQRILEDVHTGLHYFTIADVTTGGEVMSNNGDAILAMPSLVSKLRDATMGRRPMEDVIGYLAYFETFKGQKKTEWMTIQEIEAHAKRFSDAYTSKYSLWAMDNPHRPVMQMKTCFIKLTKSMDLSSREHEVLAKASSYGDEAQQAFEDEISSDDPNLDTEPRYQTDEFSQEAPTPVSPIVINSPSTPTGGQAQSAAQPARADSRKTAAPLPVGNPATVPMPMLTYTRAKNYYIGPHVLEKISTEELEKELENTGRAQSTKDAINVVLEWRKANPQQ